MPTDKQISQRTEAMDSNSHEPATSMATRNAITQPQQGDEIRVSLPQTPCTNYRTNTDGDAEHIQHDLNANIVEAKSPPSQRSQSPLVDECSSGEQDTPAESLQELPAVSESERGIQSDDFDAHSPGLEGEDVEDKEKDTVVYTEAMLGDQETKASFEAGVSAIEADSALKLTHIQQGLPDCGKVILKSQHVEADRSETLSVAEELMIEDPPANTTGEEEAVKWDAAVESRVIPEDEIDRTERMKENIQPANASQQHSLPPSEDHLWKQPAVVHDEDTDYLHAFLTRAKAKKAAREAGPQKVDHRASSPATKSRSALMPLSTNSPSPTKDKTPHAAQALTFNSEEIDAGKVSSPCRRSGRTRLPRPQKASMVTPSTIPVRRSNGTEFVFLQRTDAQQIALATRSNTKRNKGDGVLPKYKLKQLCKQPPESPLKSPRKKAGNKEVSWDDQPSYFGSRTEEEFRDDSGKQAEEKPRARKVRRLGAGNGTPAPRRVMAEDSIELKVPVPKTRARAKS